MPELPEIQLASVRRRWTYWRSWKRFDVALAITLFVAFIFGVIFLVSILSNRTITVSNPPKPSGPVSPLTGLPCPEVNHRPIAAMLSSDPEARPLAGISQADMVFEMPVTPNGVTRLMTVFQCRIPAEIGSIRSARLDFIPLAQGLHALLAHWGAEHDALALLNARVVDNIDGLLFDGTTYYRKRGVPSPHDGFTTLASLYDRASRLGYTASASVQTYQHLKETPEPLTSGIGMMASISWLSQMSVVFRYDPATNMYARERGGTPELDALSRQQVRAPVVIVIKTDASFLYDQYISVRTTGQGVATLYQNGRATNVRWQKPSVSDMLTFVDAQGSPVPLVPGLIWVMFNPLLPSTP